MSLDEALRYQLRVSPSYRPEGDPRPRLYGLCVPTGRYCSRSANKCCDPFREGRRSEFVAYGAGVTALFKTLKWLAWVFVFVSILAIPCIAINLNGTSNSISKNFGLVSTTLGNLQYTDAVVASTVVVTTTPCSAANYSVYVHTASASNANSGSVSAHFGGTVVTLPAEWSPLTYAFADVAGVVLILVAWIGLKLAESAENDEVGAAARPAIETYSVRLAG